MEKMDRKVNQRLKSQAKEMGIKMKDAQVMYDAKNGYHLKGYKPGGAIAALNKGIKDGTIAERVAERKRRMDDAIDGKQ